VRSLQDILRRLLNVRYCAYSYLTITSLNEYTLFFHRSSGVRCLVACRRPKQRTLLPLRHEVALCEWTRGLEGRLCRRRSSGRVLTARSRPWRAPPVTAGFEASGNGPRSPGPSGDHRPGADRAGESREPPLMPREEWPCGGMWSRGAGTGRWEAAGAGRARHPVRESTAVPGVEGAPTPVISRRCGTWKPRPGPAARWRPVSQP
jgi:hypothetical protein